MIKYSLNTIRYFKIWVFFVCVVWSSNWVLWCQLIKINIMSKYKVWQIRLFYLISADLDDSFKKVAWKNQLKYLPIHWKNRILGNLVISLKVHLIMTGIISQYLLSISCFWFEILEKTARKLSLTSVTNRCYPT